MAFIDTSVLDNVVPVPGRDQDRETVEIGLKDRVERGVRLVLPVTAVIETGNHVAQVKDGRARRTTAERFVRLLELVRDGKAPWQFNPAAWSEDYWDALLRGASTGQTLLDLLCQQMGTGDLAIIAERDKYVAASGLPSDSVEVWTLDGLLAAQG
ncbi:hypothetical protein [Myceligenerans crystallogenes]|uniref:hypothetical protein n=1 Tax=Myceligenerans crystallogenes TaxID=316335 RepID=UPI0031CE41EA